MTQLQKKNPKQCMPTFSQVSDLFIPKSPYTMIQSVMDMFFCVLCVPVLSASYSSARQCSIGNITEPKGDV